MTARLLSARWVWAPLAALGAWSLVPSGAHAGTPPPPAGFTPNVVASVGGTGSPNEPQVAVDQNGTSYVTWQGADGTSKSTDGTIFTSLGNPDPNTAETGDVEITTSSFFATCAAPTGPGAGQGCPHPDGGGDTTGNSTVFWGNLGKTQCTDPFLPINIRSARSLTGSTWTNQADSGCQPEQIDRPWIAAYTPAQFRGTDLAANNTIVYHEYHDFGQSSIWVEVSTDGGQSWNTLSNPVGPGTQETLSTCNTIPGGVAVEQNGPHPGRVFVVWATSDLNQNIVQGCNYTEAEAFDHVYMAYSDNATAQVPTWTSSDVFDDPCLSTVPPSPTNCNDTAEIFTPIAVDDAGNAYVAFVWRAWPQPNPEYDVYVASSMAPNEGNSWTVHRANTDTGTHYFPWIAAAGTGGVDVVYYDTPYVEGVGTVNKPAAAPNTALWTVQMSQSLDGGATWTQSPVSDHVMYYGDICTTGIFCGLAPPQTNWGNDRILLDDFGVAVGPDGGARVAWTDASKAFVANGGTCTPGVSATSCQSGKTNVQFACQSSGRSLTGYTLTGCGQVAELSANVPDTGWVPALVLGGAAAVGARRLLVRRRAASAL